MLANLLNTLASHLWPVFLVVFFFAGSIFVHELGHFLAARRFGMHVERFSIGFGPPIWSKRGRDGVEYRIAWFPIGGYVALPQLVDLGVVEGKIETDVSKLPPIGYKAKMVVFAAGALFNLLFAFAIAGVIWVCGQPEPVDLQTTRIGYVSPTLEMPDGSRIQSPAMAAGLKAGDVIKAIDGSPVKDWPDVTQLIAMSSGRDPAGRPRTVLRIDRSGRVFDLALYPRIAGFERFRRIGIVSAGVPIVYQVAAGSVAQKAGFKPGDQIVRMRGAPVLSDLAVWDELEADATAPVSIGVLRAGRALTIVVPARPPRTGAEIGLDLTVAFSMTHPSPWSQIAEQVTATFRTLGSLLNPRSDIGLSKMSGPIGIVHNLVESATLAGIRAVLAFTILVNVNLAIFNLLPLPVLDGGQMVFATIGRLRGRALPVDFVMTAQLVFSVLLVSVILYISVFDVRRWAHDRELESSAAVSKP